MAEKSKAELRAQIQILKAKVQSNTLARSIEALAKWGGISACAFFGYKAIEALAGKTTWTDIKFMVDGCSIDCKWALIAGGISLLVGVLCAVIGIVYGTWQKRLRGDLIKEKSARITELEKNLDKSRSTSGLSPTGQTTEGR